ncbi:beta-ketoacyl-[acyl-carrier-protein] synthase family protein [Streptomyces griseofuscus]|uniref:hypothetical protein n=2 Tax=Streptomyces griseofuscus TaxID=146922 RepID=UPI00370203BB
MDVRVTGPGAMTPLGVDMPHPWAGMRSIAGGMGYPEGERARELPVRIAGRLADLPELPSERFAVVLGTSTGGAAFPSAENRWTRQAVPMLSSAFARPEPRSLPQMTALSMSNGDQVRAGRPFGAWRNAFVVAEGDAAAAPERADHARPCPSRPHNGPGARTGPTAAHSTASGVAEHVHDHGLSTPQDDTCESDVITESVGTHTVVTATKYMTGHIPGASGAMGTAVAVPRSRRVRDSSGSR